MEEEKVYFNPGSLLVEMMEYTTQDTRAGHV